MDLRFTLPELNALDDIGTEVLLACVMQDERPAQGVAGLLDWRMAGRISNLMVSGFITGKVGECVMLQGKPKLPFDKVVLFGLGMSADFEESVYQAVTERMLRTIEQLRARSAVVELPGRHLDAIPAERAAGLLLATVGDSRAHDVWTLIEKPEAQRSITRHMVQERHRVRRA